MSIKELSEMNGRVYVHFKSAAQGLDFLRQAEQEGFTFTDGAKPTSRQCSDIIAVNKDGTINYVGTNGRIAYHSGVKKIGNEKLIRIEYDNSEKKKRLSFLIGFKFKNIARLTVEPTA